MQKNRIANPKKEINKPTLARTRAVNIPDIKNMIFLAQTTNNVDNNPDKIRTPPRIIVEYFESKEKVLCLKISSEYASFAATPER